jgi:hypothetical protein
MGGIFVLLPGLLLYLLLSEALDLIVTLVSPIADLFPEGTFDKVEFPVMVGLILILAVSFFFIKIKHQIRVLTKDSTNDSNRSIKNRATSGRVALSSGTDDTGWRMAQPAAHSRRNQDFAWD